MKNEWMWGPDQDKAFEEVKKELTKPTVLATYATSAPTKIAADASSYGLGAALMQQHGPEWRPIAYASRVMTETERHYAQIEKEALAVTWACEKFRSYLLGLAFVIETDHKPLVPLLSTKCLSSLPPRIIRFQLRLDSSTYSVIHVPGKLLYTADTLSRAPLDSLIDGSEDKVQNLGSATIVTLPASSATLDTYMKAQNMDALCQQIIEFCHTGWPKHTDLSLSLFKKVKSQFSVVDGLLLYNCKIIVPKSLQSVALEKLHQGHQGVEHCLLRAKMAVWWPGITQRIKQMSNIAQFVLK